MAATIFHKPENGMAKKSDLVEQIRNQEYTQDATIRIAELPERCAAAGCQNKVGEGLFYLLTIGVNVVIAVCGPCKKDMLDR